MGANQQDGVSHASRLAAISIGDEITFRHDGRLVTGVVEGWIDRLVNGRFAKCAEIKDSRLWVPVGAIVSRQRFSGSGAGVISFELFED